MYRYTSLPLRHFGHSRLFSAVSTLGQHRCVHDNIHDVLEAQIRRDTRAAAAGMFTWGVMMGIGVICDSTPLCIGSIGPMFVYQTHCKIAARYHIELLRNLPAISDNNPQ